MTPEQIKRNYPLTAFWPLRSGDVLMARDTGKGVTILVLSVVQLAEAEAPNNDRASFYRLLGHPMRECRAELLIKGPSGNDHRLCAYITECSSWTLLYRKEAQ